MTKHAGSVPTPANALSQHIFSADTPALDVHKYLAGDARSSAFNKTAEEREPARLSGVPLGSNLLVRRNEVERKGLVQSVADQVSDEFTVLAVGEDVSTIEVGDIAVGRKFAGVGTELKYQGREYLIIDISDCLLRIPAKD